MTAFQVGNAHYKWQPESLREKYICCWFGCRSWNPFVRSKVSRLCHSFIVGVAVTASIFTLTALSVDRYLAIKAPLSLRRISSKCQATRFLFGIWLLAALFVGPMLIVRSVYTVTFSHFHISMSYCIERWPENLNRGVYSIVMLVVNYVIPILVITLCYIMIGRTLCSDEFHRKTSDSSSTVMLGRKRVARMLIALIAVFFTCWLPYNIVSLSLDLDPKYKHTQILPFTMWFAHTHSALNPLLYWFLNKGFRHCMKKAVTCESVKKAPKDTPSPQYVWHVCIASSATNRQRRYRGVMYQCCGETRSRHPHRQRQKQYRGVMYQCCVDTRTRHPHCCASAVHHCSPNYKHTSHISLGQPSVRTGPVLCSFPVVTMVTETLHDGKCNLSISCGEERKRPGRHGGRNSVSYACRWLVSFHVSRLGVIVNLMAMHVLLLDCWPFLGIH